jgi:RNA polymerase sigma-70 factor, ECF subfamily
MVEPPDRTARHLRAAREGSRNALGHALESCRKYLLLVATKELDPDLCAKGGASDLVQQTFLEAQQDFGKFQGTSESELLPWLRQILLNNIANFTRHYRGTGKRDIGREISVGPDDSANPGLDPAASDLTPSSEAMEREQAAKLQQALERLPEDYRQVIEHRYVKKLTFGEVGLKMNRSAEAARKLWSRAMAQLRQEWEKSP